MENIKLFAVLLSLLVVLLIVGNLFWENPEQRFESTQEMMDTYVTISIYHNDEEKAKEIIKTAFDRIREIISIASRFDPSSELYKLNINGTIENPSPELLDMIKTSVSYWNITDGAFDITILPLLNLWNDDKGLLTISDSFEQELNSGEFSESLRNNFSSIQPPIYDINETPTVKIEGEGWTISSSWQQYHITKEDENHLKISTKFYYLPYETQQEYINQTLPLIGSDKIMISNDKIQLEPGMSITLDGIAKGYIVDEALQTLKDSGIKNAMIDAGGDIATLGTKPGGEKWVIGLRNPNNKSESIAEFQLTDMAITTSGNYERYFDEDATIGHIMDPHTGRSVYKCSSASIIAENCTEADILSTAIFVHGPEKGIQIVETLPNVETIILGYENPKEITYSSGIQKFMIER
jgi:thiamine biosynthesis lipoprotein ApbE